MKPLLTRLPDARQWHWISSAIALAGLLLFAVTGFTLNHASQIEGQNHTVSLEVQLSPAQLALLHGRDSGPLPLALRRTLFAQHGIESPDSAAEWQNGEMYLAMPGPGRDAWLSIELQSGSLIYERSERGWIAYLNDLHKGRHTSAAWNLLIDVIAALCLVFSLSGLWLLARYARQRPGTWPLAALGLLLPVLILIFSHP